MSRRAPFALALALLLVGCFGPSDRRPGFALSGEVAAYPDDWSFTDPHREIAIQVGTPYLLPHSVTIWCAAREGTLYLGARSPEEKRWPGWVDDDPDVRLGIGEAIYEVRLAPVDDPEEIASIRRTYAAKYELPETPPEEAPPIRYWRVERREGGPA